MVRVKVTLLDIEKPNFDKQQIVFPSKQRVKARAC